MLGLTLEGGASRRSIPEMVFTPDGSFRAQLRKGMVHLTFSAEFSDDKIAEINGGSVINAIPDKCIVKFADDSEKSHQRKIVTRVKT